MYMIRNLNSQYWYGETIGIIVLQGRYPCIPGNVANATTYDFPVRYDSVTGATSKELIYQGGEGLLDEFISAARRLEASGVRAITGACGFMALFQKEVQEAVNIPVFLTSLLQIPFVHSITGRPVGVISADKSVLSGMNLSSLGIEPGDCRIGGMENSLAFKSAILDESGTLDSEAIEEELVEVVRSLLHDEPDLGALLLECSDLPPYAHRLYEEFGLPVFDYTTMINQVAAAYSPRPYVGRY